MIKFFTSSASSGGTWSHLLQTNRAQFEEDSLCWSRDTSLTYSISFSTYRQTDGSKPFLWCFYYYFIITNYFFGHLGKSGLVMITYSTLSFWFGQYFSFISEYLSIFYYSYLYYKTCECKYFKLKKQKYFKFSIRMF